MRKAIRSGVPSRAPPEAPRSIEKGQFKCDREGNPNITEINIGRFFMITPAFDWTGRYNTAEIYLRSAFDDLIDIDDPLGDFPAEETYLMRELDITPDVATLRQIDEKVHRVPSNVP